MIRLYENWINEGTEAKLIELCNVLAETRGRFQQPVLKKCDRSLVMRFGPGMDYADRRVSPVIPAQIYALCVRLALEVPLFHQDKPIFDREPDSVTVNKYERGASLAHHVDHPNGGELIATLGIGGDGRLEFRRDRDEPVAIASPVRGLVTFDGPERTQWTHAMLPATAERWSIVFRACLPQHPTQKR